MKLKKFYNVKTIKIKCNCGCNMYVKLMEKQPDFKAYKVIIEHNNFYCMRCGRKIVTTAKVLKAVMT